jgi:D-xylose transport system substrate-binding protein
MQSPSLPGVPLTDEVVFLRSVSKAVAAVAIASSAALFVAACGSSSSGGASKLSASQVPKLSDSDFKLDFSAMAKLKILASHGSGKIAAILPDTVSSTRYVEFDAPYLAKAMTDAGLSKPDQIIQNAQGQDATQYADAQADITKGAKVLIVDPLDPATGQKIESYAKKQGVPVIDYDRITLGGSRKYYVSFNNVFVGTLLGQGLESCITAWKVKSPKVIVMRGDPTDNNATLFADGYDAVLAPKFSSKAYTDVANPAGTWTPTTALTEFQAAYTKNPDANALLSPNDENASPIIHYLVGKGIKPDTFPVTGQDATLAGIQQVISGYQCGTVYKPIYLEAQAAVALAMYLRAGVTPPSSLVNGTVKDIDESNAPVPSILLTPEWVTPQTVEQTIVADNFVPASQICASSSPASGQPTYAADCTKYGIK